MDALCDVQGSRDRRLMFFYLSLIHANTYMHSAKRYIGMKSVFVETPDSEVEGLKLKKSVS